MTVAAWADDANATPATIASDTSKPSLRIIPILPPSPVGTQRLEINVNRVAEVDPVVDVLRERDRIPDAAVARRLVHRHGVVAVGRIAPDEVDGVVHALRVVARVLAIEVEGAPHGRCGWLAGRDVEGRDHVIAVDQRHYLARDVDLDVVTRVVAGPEAALVLEQLLEDHRLVLIVPGHVVDLAEREGRELRAVVELAADVAAGVVA